MREKGEEVEVMVTLIVAAKKYLTLGLSFKLM